MDTNGNAVSVEIELSTKANLTTVASSFVSKTNPIITLTIGSNAISFQTLAGNTSYINNIMLESLYTNYNIWKTSFPIVDLSPYVTTTGLAPALGSYVKTTDLTPHVTTVSLTTTLGTSARSTDLNSYVSSTALTTTLGAYVSSTGLTTALGSYVSSTSLTTTLGIYIPKSGGTFHRE